MERFATTLRLVWMLSGLALILLVPLGMPLEATIALGVGFGLGAAIRFYKDGGATPAEVIADVVFMGSGCVGYTLAGFPQAGLLLGTFVVTGLGAAVVWIAGIHAHTQVWNKVEMVFVAQWFTVGGVTTALGVALAWPGGSWMKFWVLLAPACAYAYFAFLRWFSATRSVQPTT